MKWSCRIPALCLGLIAIPFAYAADKSLAALLPHFVDNVARTNLFFMNEYHLKSYAVKTTTRASDHDTIVVVEYSRDGKIHREELIYRILEAELFLMDETSDLGISGLARIEWTWALSKNPGRLQGVGDGFENYLVLSIKGDAWASPNDEALARNVFRKVKTRWEENPQGKHERLKPETAQSSP